MALPIIILGGGGHAKVVIDALLQQAREILGFCSLEQNARPLLGLKCLGGDEIVLAFGADRVRLANGIGAAGTIQSRRSIYELFASQGYIFEKVLHPSAITASDVHLDAGVQIMAGAVVQPGTRIGSNSIVNTNASVDHDCWLGNHVHIAPGATLCGNVKVGNEAFIGAGATVIQGKSIGARSVIGAGAVVIEDIPADVTVVGVPAKVIHPKLTLPLNQIAES
jgi:UDP-perosamine 4-acetyltransferase